jgi:DNA-binding CsgD family transcriptional regulator
MNDPLAVRETLPNEDVKRNHPNDALAGRPIFPNEQATKNYLASTYGPQVQKTFIGALESFFASEFPQLAGDRARRAIVQAIVDLTLRFFPATTHLRQGQTTWVSVDKNETSAYGKSMAKTRLVPVIISLMADDEAKQRQNGKKLTDLKREAVARICHEVDTQGGCITAAELALILKTTPPTIGKYIAHWQTENDQLLPRRGTIHDMGPTLTHKKQICRLLFLDGKTVSETVRLTNHSPQAIHRYITNFRQVFTCKTKGLTPDETARATKLSPRLVTEYHKLFDEYAVTNDKFADLLKQKTKP